MSGQTPLFERLAVLDDPVPRDAAFNMAADEALLHGLGDTPLLRLYSWKQPAVSFGYFTPHAAVQKDHPARELVRRWTGGGVVEHGEDLTYSLLVPRSHPLTNGPAGESYRLIHETVRGVLRGVGWQEADLALGSDNEPDLAAKGCFGHPVRHDLLSEGSKIGGAAQRRTRGGLLHQGSLLLLEVTGGAREELARRLPAALGRQLRARAAMTEAELLTTDQLSREKYVTDFWTRRV